MIGELEDFFLDFDLVFMFFLLDVVGIFGELLYLSAEILVFCLLIGENGILFILVCSLIVDFLIIGFVLSEYSEGRFIFVIFIRKR